MERLLQILIRTTLLESLMMGVALSVQAQSQPVRLAELPRASRDFAEVDDLGYFTIVNADTDEDIQPLNEGDIYIKPANTNINIRYNPEGAPGSVVFRHQNKRVRTENEPPFAVRGDYSGDYLPWTEAIPGSHRIDATPWSEDEGMGIAGTTHTVNFRIEEEKPQVDPPPSGNKEWLSKINIYPNPAFGGNPELTISGYMGMKEVLRTQVEIWNFAGEVLFSEIIYCGGGDCGSYLMKVNEELSPGVYVVKLKANGVQISKRLLVR